MNLRGRRRELLSQAAAILRLVQMPLPIQVTPHPTGPFTAAFNSKHGANSIPSKPHSFVADINATLAQQVFHISLRQWKSNAEHHRQAGNFGSGFKAAKRGAFFHASPPDHHPALRNRVSSDMAVGATLTTKLASQFCTPSGPLALLFEVFSGRHSRMFFKCPVEMGQVFEASIQTRKNYIAGFRDQSLCNIKSLFDHVLLR